MVLYKLSHSVVLSFAEHSLNNYSQLPCRSCVESRVLFLYKKNKAILLYRLVKECPIVFSHGYISLN